MLASPCVAADGENFTEALGIDYGAICSQRAQDAILPDRCDAHKVHSEVFEDARDLLLVRIVPIPATTAELLCRVFFRRIGMCRHLIFSFVGIF